MRWRGVPVAARVVVSVVVVVLLYGTGVHVVQLAVGGADPYPAVPTWLAAFYVSLVVLDPLAAVLLLRRSRVGIVLAVAVLATNAVGNGYANFILDHGAGFSVGRAAVVVVAGLAVALLVSVRRVWPATIVRGLAAACATRHPEAMMEHGREPGGRGIL